MAIDKTHKRCMHRITALCTCATIESTGDELWRIGDEQLIEYKPPNSLSFSHTHWADSIDRYTDIEKMMMSVLMLEH